MEYVLIKPPIISFDFATASKELLKGYWEWFFRVLPERIKYLTDCVHETPGFEKWRADFSVESLNMLSEWFAQVVETKDATPEEIARELEETKNIIPGLYSPKKLTGKTISIIMDVGMYLGEVFIRNHPSLVWWQRKTSVRHVDYGHVLLSGFGKRGAFNPFRMVHVQAWDSIKSNKQGRFVGLREVYDIWSKFVVPGSEKR